MWNFNTDKNTWSRQKDGLKYSDYELYLKELSDYRLYSKCVSGSTFVPFSDSDDVFNILGEYQKKNWFIGPNGSQYTYTVMPPENVFEISKDNEKEYYEKYLGEYGLTLKNYFTPDKAIKESLDNINYVDVASTVAIININDKVTDGYIDGVRLKNGHRVLLKDQKSREVIPVEIDPNEYFMTSYNIIQNYGSTIEYEYYNEENGIYEYQDGFLIKTDDLDNYSSTINYSVVVKLGSQKEKQFHLKRLNSGYFSDSEANDPVEFIENENWIVRNKVEYNNLFETNYNAIISHSESTYVFEDRTYTIPQRVISVGEYGVISVLQEENINIINNKYKENLNSIVNSQTYYWAVGDNGLILKIRKHDLLIEQIDIDSLFADDFIPNLNSINFINNNIGAVVGDLNTILITIDGGITWEKIEIEDFDSFYFSKVIFTAPNKFFVGGKNGIFLEIYKKLSKWEVYKRRISKYENFDDEYILVEDINDIIYVPTSGWDNLYHEYSDYTISDFKELLFIVTNENKILIKDLNKSLSDEFEFFYLEYPGSFSDIINIERIPSSNVFLITGMDEYDNVGVFSFSLEDFSRIGKSDSYSNIIISETPFETIFDLYPNDIVFGEEIYLAGNNSLLMKGDYSDLGNIILEDFNNNLHNKLKSKLLVLDYDIASKLNFFDKDGNYILPSPTEVSLNTTPGSYLSFEPITYNSGEPSYIDYTEYNWFEYWRDGEMNFEYKTTDPMGEDSKVLISPTFSFYSGVSSEITNDITNTHDDIKDLAPDILLDDFSRYTIDEDISSPSNLFKMYFFKYLIIYRVDTSYQVNRGDVFKMSCNLFDDVFVANKIITLGGQKYIYFFSEFNDNINKNIVGESITITNLNVYSSETKFIERFAQHPISKGYKSSESEGGILFEGNFSYETAYYNLATSIKTNTDEYFLSYEDSFLKFGYTPTYNLLDYLEYLNYENNPNYAFYADKEFLAMPEYRKIPCNGLGISNSDNVYIDYSSSTNKISFGENLKFEWNSIFINTFVDINIYQDADYENITPNSTDRLLVANKYIENGRYVIEFHNKMKFTEDTPVYYIDIKSRRKLRQISEDLSLINNIQRSLKNKKYTGGDPTYTVPSIWATDYLTFEKELNYKINTDSYCKILLSDSVMVEMITGVIYTDNNNLLSLNICNLETSKRVRINNTASYTNKLFISCDEKHGLMDGDGAVFVFDGGENSSEYLNPQYFGYHTINFINEYTFTVNVDYGTTPAVGNDTGYLYYVKKDPLLNYSPIDLIEVGSNKKGKRNIELNKNNIIIEDNKYKLNSVDYSKFRFRLVDNLDVEFLANNYNWIYEAEISDAVIGLNENGIVWYKGKWECGRWFGGTWISGTWLSGDWYGGTWCAKSIKDNYNSVDIDEKSSNKKYSEWRSGRWYDGVWENGIWINGRWYEGEWQRGEWYGGTWNSGWWKTGKFTGGIWIDGTWERGVFNCDNGPAYWVDGVWKGGDFENGLWFGGTFEQKNQESRFGTKSHNSRTSIWKGGKFVGGTFHSRLNLDEDDNYKRADIHKYSIWHSGEWVRGEWYGGVAYNINFKSGTWHGGILEDIQIIGCGQDVELDNYFILNGIFRFNIGDKIKVIDNLLDNDYSHLGSNSSPGDYTVLFTLENNSLNQTKVYVNREIDINTNAPTDLGIRLVSHFENCNWKSGVWTNGIFEEGLWENGIWYNGVFNGTWT